MDVVVFVGCLYGFFSFFAAVDDDGVILLCHASF